MEIQDKAKQIVFDYVKSHLEKTDTHVTFAIDEVYIVWWSKTLQNWKALLSTTLPDGMYYEVTHDGDNGKTYLDAYKKFDNVSIDDVEDLPLRTSKPDTESFDPHAQHEASMKNE